MKQILIYLTFGFFLCGFGWCTNVLRQTTNIKIINKQEVDSLEPKYKLVSDSLKMADTKISIKKTIKDYCDDRQYLHWRPNHSDTTNYMCEISFRKITVLYWFHGQCAYDYFTYVTSDSTMEVLWLYRKDCILNMDFLEKSNGIKKYPKLGNTFATMTLTNDTTLRVKYNFPVWTKKVNRITKDSLFPNYYYLTHDY